MSRQWRENGLRAERGTRLATSTFCRISGRLDRTVGPEAGRRQPAQGLAHHDLRAKFGSQIFRRKIEEDQKVGSGFVVWSGDEWELLI